jgi:hypothetical protein
MDHSIPVAGIAISSLEGGRWGLSFPVRKNSTAIRFGLGDIANAAEIVLWENLPSGWEVDGDKPVERRVSEQKDRNPSDGEPMIAVSIVVHLKPKNSQ